jgi:hypothetical protein
MTHELETIYKAAQVVSHAAGLQAVFEAGVRSTLVVREEQLEAAEVVADQPVDPSPDVVASRKASKA